jgi:protein TonB
MTGGQNRPEPTSASLTKQDRADDLLGAVVPLRARDYSATSSPESDLSNVVPFAPRSRKTVGLNAPAIECTVADRPAPQTYSRDRQRQIALLIGGSLLIHGAIFAAFNREPEPHASIGMISINAEIVLGAQADAGLTPSPSQSAASTFSPETEKPTDDKPEVARKDIAEKPVEAPKEQAADKTEPVAPKAQEALPAETPPEPKQAELVAVPKPVEKPTLTATPDQKKPEAKETKEKKVREAARHAKDDGESLRDRKAPASPQSVSSGSIGRGRSDLDTNYRGIVSAHLARYKQMPSNVAQGSHGIATVSFSLSGSGSVASVRLVRGSGVASFDQEATAMVRRASPFPAPPSGRAQSFTVPVSFHLR